MARIGTESTRRTLFESVLIPFFISQIVSYFRITYVVGENLTHVNIKTTYEYVLALERATEICPQQRICGGLVDDYAEEPIRLQLYLDAMDRQEQKAQSSNSNPCCYPCSCDEDCMVTQTCCPATFSSFNYPNLSLEPELYLLRCQDSYTWSTIESNLLVEQKKIPTLRYATLLKCPFSSDSQTKGQCVF